MVLNLLVNGAPLVNVILIVALVIGGKRSPSFPFIMFFFIYGAFHYTYAVPAMFAGKFMVMYNFRFYTNANALIAEAVFFLVWIYFFIVNNRDEILKNTNTQKLLVSLISIYLILFTMYYVFFPESGRQLIIVKNAISILLMLFFAYMFSILFQKRPNKWNIENSQWLMFFTVVVLTVGFYEVFNGSSWTQTLLADGRIVSRASATMLNPNVLGLWASFLILFGVYMRDMKKMSLQFTVIFFLLGTIGIYISGSRTAVLLCGVLLFGISVLKIVAGMKFMHALRHANAFMVLFCALTYLGTFHTAALSPLSDRFLSIPQSIVSVVSGDKVDQQVLLSVYGRFGIDAEAELKTETKAKTGEPITYDNAYLSLRTSNYAAFVTWMLMLAFFVITGINRYWKEKSIQAVYALTALTGFISIGFTMRAYQLFPIWGLSSLMLAVFIVWLSGGDVLTSRKGGNSAQHS